MPTYIVRGAMVREEDKNNWENWRLYYNEVKREEDVHPSVVAEEEFKRLLNACRMRESRMIPICFHECWSAEKKTI